MQRAMCGALPLQIAWEAERAASKDALAKSWSRLEALGATAGAAGASEEEAWQAKAAAAAAEAEASELRRRLAEANGERDDAERRLRTARATEASLQTTLAVTSLRCTALHCAALHGLVVARARTTCTDTAPTASTNNNSSSNNRNNSNNTRATCTEQIHGQQIEHLRVPPSSPARVSTPHIPQAQAAQLLAAQSANQQNGLGGGGGGSGQSSRDRGVAWVDDRDRDRMERAQASSAARERATSSSPRGNRFSATVAEAKLSPSHADSRHTNSGERGGERGGFGVPLSRRAITAEGAAGHLK